MHALAIVEATVPEQAVGLAAADFDPRRVPGRLQRNPEPARDGLAERPPQGYLHQMGQDAAVQMKRLQYKEGAFESRTEHPPTTL